MKKQTLKSRAIKLATAGVILTSLTGVVGTQVAYSNERAVNAVNLSIDGEVYHVPDDMGTVYVTKEGRTMVPFRVIGESMGAKVDYIADKKKVTVNDEDTSIELTVGNKTALVNGTKTVLEVPANIKENRTYVPLRFVGESMGASVSYESSTRTVYINTNGEAPVVKPEQPTEGFVGINNMVPGKEYAPNEIFSDYNEHLGTFKDIAGPDINNDPIEVSVRYGKFGDELLPGKVAVKNLVWLTKDKTIMGIESEGKPFTVNVLFLKGNEILKAESARGIETYNGVLTTNLGDENTKSFFEKADKIGFYVSISNNVLIVDKPNTLETKNRK